MFLQENAQILPIKHKKHDSIFAALMRDKTNVLNVYLALHPEDEDKVTVDDVQNVTIQNVILDGPYNDLSFMVGNRQIVMVEAQSTWSENIPFRILLYAAQNYQTLVEKQDLDLYRSKALPIPALESVLIYTGDKKRIPKILKLSDTVFKGKKSSLELVVKVVCAPGKETIINQYIGFCHVFKAQVAKYGKTQKAIDETLRICRSREYLVQFIEEHKHEVVSMMSTLFDQDKLWARHVRGYGRDQYEDGIAKGMADGIAKGMADGIAKGMADGMAKGMADGMAKGMAKGMADGIIKVAQNLLGSGFSKDDIAKNTGLSLEEVEKLATRIAH